MVVQSLSGADFTGLIHRVSKVPAELSGLWIPAGHGDHDALARELGHSWAGFRWIGVRTWMRSRTSELSGFADRYSTLTDGLVADCTFTTPRGLVGRAEWADLNTSSNDLPGFLTDVRLTGGAGSCTLLTQVEAPASTWYAPSLAVVRRGMTAFDRPPAVDPATADDAAINELLAATVTSGFAVVASLDVHPWGGFAVLGAAPLLADLRESVGPEVSGVADVTPAEVASAAGGLVL